MGWLNLEKSVVIRAPKEEIYAELVEPHRQIGLQPLLVDVEEIERSENDDGSAFRVFDAVERFRFLGVLRWRNRIRVRIDLTRSGEVADFEARSAPGIKVRSRFTLSARGDGTAVREQIHVEVPALLRGFVAGQVERAQDRLLANLKSRLEGRRGTR
jgi:hypothetical protein